MAKNYYMPKDDSGKAELLEHLATRLPIYAELLEISTADINSLQADATAFRYTLSAFNVVQGNGRLWTACKNLQRAGGTGTTVSTGAGNIPDGVRLVLQLPPGRAITGRLTRDWVRPTVGGGKS